MPCQKPACQTMSAWPNLKGPPCPLHHPHCSWGPRFRFWRKPGLKENAQLRFSFPLGGNIEVVLYVCELSPYLILPAREYVQQKSECDIMCQRHGRCVGLCLVLNLDFLARRHQSSPVFWSLITSRASPAAQCQEKMPCRSTPSNQLQHSIVQANHICAFQCHSAIKPVEICISQFS